MAKEIELLFKPLADDWWERFATRFGDYQFSSQGVDAGTARQFCSLHFGLRRQQVKLLSRYWQQQGRIQLARKGWMIRQAPSSQITKVGGGR